MEQLKDWLYELVIRIAQVHDSLWDYNRSFSSPFTDKELHFIVIGAFGMLVLLAALPLFRWLTLRGRDGIMAWLFTLAVVLFITFAIEIGQKLTDTGSMELADIVYGVVGFLIATAAFTLLYLLLCLIKRLFRRK